MAMVGSTPTRFRQSKRLNPLRNPLGNPFSTSQRQTDNLALRQLHFIGDDSAVHVHRCSDVRVPHQPLLNGNRGTDRIKPTSVRVPHTVRSQSANTAFCSCLLE
jgi:hypothetical protein